jgi:two-component system, cell cycle sensor histidine kinase and response regulator CckA
MTFLAAVIIVVPPIAVILLLLQASAGRQQTINDLKAELNKQAEALKHSEHQQELMFTANPYPMWIFDHRSLRFLSVNDAAVKAYGYSREEFLAMTLPDIHPQEEVSRLLEFMQQVDVGYVRPGVRRHRRKDGSIIFVEIMAFRYDRDDSSQEMVLALDVTERQGMEEALRESESRLKRLIDDAPFGIVLSRIADGRLQTTNPAMLEMLGGYSLEEALELNIAEQIYADPKDRQRLIDAVRHCGQLQGWETSFRGRNGTLVPVRLTSSIRSSNNGAPELLATYIEDMTQQNKLEQQVRQVQKLEAVGRLAGGMAHDFNNVLVVIKLSTEMMLEKVTPDSPFSKPLLQISNAADRAAKLTRQMLAFGRQQIMLPRIINLNTVVSETIQMLRQVIGEDIQLVTKLAEKLESSRLDPDQVTQVIFNLAVNARDAMPDGGMLHMETATVTLDESYAEFHTVVQPGRYVMLAVSDTGSGIDNAVLPRIFDPFFTTKEVGKGTGLGLSIVYGIVKQSGGHIWVYSEPGHGTTFKLYFPATTAQPERPLVRPDGIGHVSGQTLLVVEDECLIRANVCECLQQLGYKVLEADNGTTALKICEDLRGEIDLVVTDLVMTGSSGQALASNLGERFPQIRVLFMSGYTEDNASRRDILAKGSPFLQKPFSVGELAKAVSDALAFSQAYLEKPEAATQSSSVTEATSAHLTVDPVAGGGVPAAPATGQ